MNHSPQHSQALAVAIHDRLVEGGDVALTGFGLLRRVHEPARVVTREDGRKELFPPQNVIRFLPDASLLTQCDDALVRALSDALPEDPRDPREILDDAVSRLRESFATEKDLVLENVGRFFDEDGLTTFEPADALVGVVNKPFAGLPPIAPRTKAAPGDSATEVASEALTDPVEEASVQEEETGAGDSSELDTAEMPSSDPMEEPESDPATREDFLESTEKPPPLPRTTILDTLAGQSTGDTEEPTSETPASQASENEPESVPPPPPTADDEAETVSVEETSGEDVPEDDVPGKDIIVGGMAAPEAQAEVDPGADETEAHEPEDAATNDDSDDDIDALLEGVWMPAAAASGEAVKEPASETEDHPSDYAEAGSKEDDAAVPLVAAGAGAAAAFAAHIKIASNAEARFEKEKRRNRMAFGFVAALLVLCVLAVIVLWPRFNNRSTVDPQAVENGRTASSGNASAELYATHPGGTTDSERVDDTDLSTFDSPQMQLEEGASTLVPDAEPTVERPQPIAGPTANPAPSPAATPALPAPSARQEPAQPQTGSQLPRQLRGPGQVNPAQGGATWILASGNRTSAEELAARYRRQGYRSSVLAGEANGLTVYRVAVGQFANAAEARGLRSRLPSDAPASTWVLNF